MRKLGQRPLTPDDWAKAALRAIARGGIDAVAVETVAAELGATKGSFYWHFSDRDALIQAALDKWEQRRTEAAIEDFEREPDPAARLKNILGAGYEFGPTDKAEIVLLANPEHPAAVRAVRRVAERRITYIAEQLEKLGWDATEALDRAVVLYDVYVGYMQMAHVTPHLVGAAARRRQLDLVFNAFASGKPRAKHGARERASDSSSVRR